jgi:hypothetical protein
VPPVNQDTANVLSALPEEPTQEHVRDLLLALSAPHTPPPTPRADDLLMWFVRLTSCSTGDTFDVRVASKLTVHIIYSIRYIKKQTRRCHPNSFLAN